MSTEIRASMLSSYMDCNRRAASKSFTDEVLDAGYVLTQLPPSAGAALGTANHAAGEYALQHKIETGTLASFQDSLDFGAEKFGDEIKAGVIWDETTPHKDTALRQMERQLRAYWPIMEQITPIALELNLKADIGDGFVLSGHIDIMTEDKQLRDEKYGAMNRPYQPQMGGYSLLARSNGYDVNGLIIDWTPRVGRNKPQPLSTSIKYDVYECESAAHGLVERIKTDIIRFREDPDGLWRAFPANPMSMMCTDRYCPAYGTNFCEAWHYKVE